MFMFTHLYLVTCKTRASYRDNTHSNTILIRKIWKVTDAWKLLSMISRRSDGIENDVDDADNDDDDVDESFSRYLGT